MKLICVSPFVSFVLTPLLALSPVYGQITAPSAGSAPSDAAPAPTLQLRLDRNSSDAPAGSHTAQGFTVEVTDRAGAAVPDAAVVLRLPDSGPSGVFAGGAHSAVAYTDSSGHATLPAIEWTATPGLVAMRVTATKGINHAGMLIQETLLSTVVPAVTAAAPLPARPAVSVVNTEPKRLAPAQPATLPSASQTVVQVPTDASVAHAPAPQTSAPLASAPLASAPLASAQQAQPSVSVTGASPAETPHHSHAKWFIIAAIAAGAGAGIAMAGMGKKGTPAAAASSLSIGAPSISVGQPGH